MIEQLIYDHLPVFIVFTIVVTISLVYAVWWARGIFDKVKKIDLLPCNKHDELLGGLKDKHLDLREGHGTLKSDISEVKISIQLIRNSLDIISKSLHNNGLDPYTESNSPIRLTEKGHKLVEDLGLNEAIDSNWLSIAKLVADNSQSKNPYDIQQFLMEQTPVFPEKFITEDTLEKIKFLAYKEGLPLIPYFNVLVILIRDRYFKEHDIDVDDVDLHDPTGPINYPDSMMDIDEIDNPGH